MNEQMAELARGAQDLLLPAELEKKLARGKPLRVKAGFDPTAPDLHLGHTVLINKMRQFQQFGHEVIFLIGDFTGLIGDPTGRNATRPRLTPEEVQANARTYRAADLQDPGSGAHPHRFQFALVRRHECRGSDRNRRPTHGRAHARARRLHQALQRQSADCDARVLYPLVQGYDSVALKADVELGGTDQKFNLLVGRQLQEQYGQEPQIVLTMPLLEGLDGVNKMSKSLGNYIAINDAAGRHVRQADVDLG